MNKEQAELIREVELLKKQPLAHRLLDLSLIQKQLSEIASADAADKSQINLKLLILIAAGHFIRMSSSQISS